MSTHNSPTHWDVRAGFSASENLEVAVSEVCTPKAFNSEAQRRRAAAHTGKRDHRCERYAESVKHKSTISDTITGYVFELHDFPACAPQRSRSEPGLWSATASRLWQLIMLLGRVIGTLVACEVYHGLEGVPMLVV